MHRSFIFEDVLKHIIKNNNIPYKLYRLSNDVNSCTYIRSKDNTQPFNIWPENDARVILNGCDGIKIKGFFDLNDPDSIESLKIFLLAALTDTKITRCSPVSEIEV